MFFFSISFLFFWGGNPKSELLLNPNLHALWMLLKPKNTYTYTYSHRYMKTHTQTLVKWIWTTENISGFLFYFILFYLIIWIFFITDVNFCHIFCFLGFCLILCVILMLISLIMEHRKNYKKLNVQKKMPINTHQIILYKKLICNIYLSMTSSAHLVAS